MARTGAGDRDAFRQLLDRHLSRITRFAERVLGNHAAAEDAAQETFLRLWTHASRWQPTATVGTWLHRVALNLCLDQRRRVRDVGLDSVPEPVDAAPSAAAALQSQDVGIHVNRKLRELPQQQQVAITLCHYQGLSNGAAAEVMGISVEALESLLARGRRSLREKLRPLLPELLDDEALNG